MDGPFTPLLPPLDLDSICSAFEQGKRFKSPPDDRFWLHTAVFGEVRPYSINQWQERMCRLAFDIGRAWKILSKEDLEKVEIYISTKKEKLDRASLLEKFPFLLIMHDLDNHIRDLNYIKDNLHIRFNIPRN
jgi:hypothetical protein